MAGNRELNYPKSCYMYKARGGKLCAGPAWDFDWGTFCYEAGWMTKNTIWYRYLFTYPEFVNTVKERWQKHRPALNTMPDYIQSIANEIAESALQDCRLWPINQSVNGDEEMTFTESVERLKQYYNNRLLWIDEYISAMY